jgi:hypothetical protein
MKRLMKAISQRFGCWIQIAKAHLLADAPGHGGVVAGDDLEPHPQIGQIPHGGWDIRLEWITQHQQAEEGHLLLGAAVDRGGRMHATGHAQHPADQSSRPCSMHGTRKARNLEIIQRG